MDEEAQRALRYVVERKNRTGGSRWYWQRRGHKPKRLPDDLLGRIAKAAALNAMADGVAPSDEGTMAWAVREYRASERFESRAAATKRAYERWLRRIAEKFGPVECSAMEHDVLARWRAKLPRKASTRNHAIAVMKNVLRIAYDQGAIKIRTWDELGTEVRATPRRQTWAAGILEAALASCPVDMRIPLLLLRESGQRPSDVLALDWRQWDGRAFQPIEQIKTRAIAEVVATKRLREALNAAQRAGGLVRASGKICVRRNGKSWTVRGLESAWARLRGKLGAAHLQIRDLRRTYATEADHAGGEMLEIAAVTGHKPGSAPTMVGGVYVAERRQRAERLTAKIDAARARESDASDCSPQVQGRNPAGNSRSGKTRG